ncbi:MAG: hypothetical protein J6O53_01545 [Eubacterium sp.]|nr:hypothetical protein [Eubacterium sp.]
MNKEIEVEGMGVKAQGSPYIIETRNESGYYKDKYDTLQSEAMEWKISSAHNFDNHSSAKKVTEDEPALEPGDCGSLEFRVSPQSFDSITVDCLFEMKAYTEVIVKDLNGDPVKDENGDPVTALTEITTGNTAGYIEGHILMFSGIDEYGKYTGLIDNDNVALERILEDQTYNKNESNYTTIYWYWPEHLNELTDSTKIKFAASEQSDVIAYIAKNKDKFFKNCSETSDKVLSDFTALAAGTSTDQVYNHYNLMYDNADLEIGNYISYIVLSMQVIQD